MFQDLHDLRFRDLLLCLLVISLLKAGTNVFAPKITLVFFKRKRKMNQRRWVKLDIYLYIGILLHLQSKIPKQIASPHVESMCCEGKERRVFDKRCKVHSLRITIAKVQCSSLSSQAGSLTHALALKGSIYIFLLGERVPLWSTETRLVRECTLYRRENAQFDIDVNSKFTR